MDTVDLPQYLDVDDWLAEDIPVAGVGQEPSVADLAAGTGYERPVMQSVDDDEFHFEFNIAVGNTAKSANDLTN